MKIKHLTWMIVIFAFILSLMSCSSTKKTTNTLSDKTEIGIEKQGNSDIKTESETKRDKQMDAALAESENHQSEESEETTVTDVTLKPGGVYVESENGKPTTTVSVNENGTVNIQKTTTKKKSVASTKKETVISEFEKFTETKKNDSTAIIFATEKYNKSHQVKAATVVKDPSLFAFLLGYFPWYYWIVILLIVLSILYFLAKRYNWFAVIGRLFKKKVPPTA